jgi:peptide/nickel transport system permease protein
MTSLESEQDSKKRFRIREVWALSLREPLGVLGALLFFSLVIVAIGAPLWAHQNPVTTSISQAFKPPLGQFWLGTDHLGRDIWSRFVYGSRISLIVAISAVALASVAGGLLGIFSGLVGGKTDSYIQRFMDSLLAMPAIVLAIIIMAVLGTSLVNVIIAIAIVGFPRVNRITRSTAVSVRESLFIESAVIAGASRWRITIRHIALNCVAPWLVYSSALLGTAFIAEASLSFLGMGVPPPTASWGRDLSDNLTRFEFAPWPCIFPGLGISMAVFSANFLGDALRNILDPRFKRI